MLAPLCKNCRQRHYGLECSAAGSTTNVGRQFQAADPVPPPKPKPKAKPKPKPVHALTKASAPPTPGFDRKAYMRELMRKRRREGKSK
jgi:hypothetical protein